MRAFQLTAQETLTAREVARPLPGPNDLLVRVRAAGLCDTDLLIYQIFDQAQAMGLRTPITLGHEFAGEVVEAGAEVVGFAPGDRVVAEPNVYCGACPSCLGGRPDACVRVQTIGMTRDGAFAEYVLVPARFTHKLPDSVDFETAGGLVEPLACAVHGYRRVRLQPGADVLIIGDGFYGLVFTMVARALGADRIGVFGHHASRLDRIRSRGADAALDERDPGAAEMAATLGGGLGPAVVIDTVGSSSSVSLALRSVAPGGRIGVFGVAGMEWRIDSALNVMLKAVDIFGLVGNPGVWPEVLRLVENGAINLSGLVSHVLPLDDLPKAFALKASRDPAVTKIVIQP
jgi:L-iditol 2-dehydrogenase